MTGSPTSLAGVRAKTRQGYECLIRHYARPHLGNFPLKELSHLHLQRLYASLPSSCAFQGPEQHNAAGAPQECWTDSAWDPIGLLSRTPTPKFHSIVDPPPPTHDGEHLPTDAAAGSWARVDLTYIVSSVL